MSADVRGWDALLVICVAGIACMLAAGALAFLALFADWPVLVVLAPLPALLAAIVFSSRIAGFVTQMTSRHRLETAFRNAP